MMVRAVILPLAVMGVMEILKNITKKRLLYACFARSASTRTSMSNFFELDIRAN